MWEWFTEFQAPLWEAESRSRGLSASVAFRQSDYNLSGVSDAWKLGLDVRMFPGVRFRATKSRDVREATFSERFDSQGGGGGVRDPLRNDLNVPITVVASGNPNLAPETADTMVAGFVFQPRWAQGLSISTDWFDVDIAGAIEQISAQEVVDRCYDDGDTAQCANIERDPVTNDISRIFRRFFNQASARVEGIDLEVTYRMDPDFFPRDESFTVRVLAGKLLTREDIAANGAVTDLMGSYTRPDVTANVTTRYGFGPWSFQLQGRFIDGGKLVRTWVEGVHVDDNSVPSETWWNSQIRYRGEFSGGGTWDLGLAVQNVFDKHPPIIPGGTAGAQSGLSSQYDVFGRRYNLSFNVSL